MGMSSGICVLLHERRDAVHPIAAEQAHEVVLEREVELRHARVALTTGTATKLVVDAARLVALGADDRETARLDDLHVLVGADALGLGERLGLLLLGRLLGLDAALAQRCPPTGSPRCRPG